MRSRSWPLCRCGADADTRTQASLAGVPSTRLFQPFAERTHTRRMARSLSSAALCAQPGEMKMKVGGPFLTLGAVAALGIGILLANIAQEHQAAAPAKPVAGSAPTTAATTAEI